MEEILIIEDDKDIQHLLSICFDQEALPYSITGLGKEAIQIVQERSPSLILLDIMLPDMDGMKVCEKLRMHTSSPIIFVSCKNSDHDKILGLSIGADDYIEKPFNIGVLMARVRAHLRRNRLLNKQSDTRYTLFSTIKVDYHAHEVYRDNNKIHLTSKEFDLLAFLARNPNQVFTSEYLLEKIWGLDTLSEKRTVVVHVYSLRRKIEEDPLNPRHIITVRGVGYKFVMD